MLLPNEPYCKVLPQIWYYYTITIEYIVYRTFTDLMKTKTLKTHMDVHSLFMILVEVELKVVL